MKITVINGTEKHGVTYRLKEIFLDSFRDFAQITEYYLPRDCPAFCSGCTSCFFAGEDTCKDSAYIQKISVSLLEADLIVMTSPVYAYHATGAMKTLLDHFAYRWMPHRPAKEMFSKRAVIITQGIGWDMGSTARDIRHSLSWWGISRVGVFNSPLMEGVVWDGLSEKRRGLLTRKMKKLAEKFARIDYSRPAKTGISVKVKFLMCRMIQKKVSKSGAESYDGRYWAAQGWLGDKRPWRS